VTTQHDAAIGAVTSLWRYPVKSMMGEQLKAVYFTEHGMLGDRAYALIDRATGKVASAKNPLKWPKLFQFGASYAKPPETSAPIPPVVIKLPDGGCVSSDSPETARLLAGALDREVELVCGAPDKPSLEEYWPDLATLAHRDEVTDEAMPAATFFDCAPVHILTTATLAKLAAFYPGGRFEPRRFRPNILVATGSPETSFVENTWVGKTIGIGAEVRIKITGDTGRCVMTTLAQDDLPRDLGILRAAAQCNQAHVGVYGEIVKPGMVRDHDPVSVIE
jgi:uncharacterized protein YcbX